MVAEKNDKSAIIELLADKCIRAILSLTTKKEYSAIELSGKLNISVSTVYRKLKLLENSELIQHVKTVRDIPGNEEKYYRCVIREAIVSFDGGKFYVSIKKENFSDKVVKFWKRVARSKSNEIEQHRK